MTIKVNFKNSLGIAGCISVRKEEAFMDVHNLLSNYFDGLKITSIERIKDCDSTFNHCFGSTLMTDQQVPVMGSFDELGDVI